MSAAGTQGSHRRNRPNQNGDVTIDRELLEELDREEPLSLAEELDKAAERVKCIGAAIAEVILATRNIHIAELQRMSVPELIATAETENIPDVSGLKKQELIFRILKERVKLKGLMYGEGTLEILPDGFGFLAQPRSPLPILPGRYLRIAQPDPPLRPAQRHTVAGRFDPPRKMSATSPCCAWKGSTATTPTS